MGDITKATGLSDFVLGALAVSRLQTVAIYPSKFELNGTLEVLENAHPGFTEMMLSGKNFSEVKKIMDADPYKQTLFIDFLFELQKSVKQQMEEQKPGSSQGIQPMELAFIGYRSIVQNGFAHIPNGNQNVCAVGHHNDQETPANIASNLSSVPEDRLQPLPGAPQLWRQYKGAHEGQHCNQPNSYTYSQLLELDRETEADSIALARLRTQGQTQMVQAIIDLRIIGAVIDPDNARHATGFFITNSGYTKPTQNDFDTISNLKNTLTKAVAEKLGISQDNSENMIRENSQKFNETAKLLIKEGKFSEPARHFIGMYLQAFERRVTPTTGGIKKELSSKASDSTEFFAQLEVMQPPVRNIAHIPAFNADILQIKVGDLSMPELFARFANNKPTHTQTIQSAAPSVKAAITV